MNADRRKLKVCLFSDHHISINPRLWKEAFFYENEGFEVVIYCMWISAEFRRRDLELIKGHSIRYECYLNMIDGEAAGISKFYYRVRKRIALEFQNISKKDTGLALTYSATRMFKAVKKEKADLYIAHMESALIAAEKLLSAGEKVAVDFEDWYSNDYLVPGRPVKLLRRLEKIALEKAVFCTATSKSMAEALKENYGVERDITVIYNGFPLSEISSDTSKNYNRSKSGMPGLLWFSRSIGPDRGIETLFECLEMLDRSVELHLLGQIREDYKSELERKFSKGKGHRLIFHEFMEHKKLLPFISSFDIGLALEESEFPSRDVTITNKILQYVQARIKILATDSKGQSEVAGYFPEMIKIVRKKDAADWCAGLRLLLDQEMPESGVMQKFREIFSWEAQEKKLKKVLSDLNITSDQRNTISSTWK